ncbi:MULTISPECIES: cytochrome b [unclassified Agarivorans]|uniref:cytochrome b n=1 Tax=unclassified Agarivorans TaxID=2636026 RepID=UPI003D7D8BEE
MQFRNTANGYGFISIMIHWLATIIVLMLFGLGLFMVDLNYYSSWYQTAPMIHKSVGILLFILMVFRLCWRYLNPQVLSLENHHPLEKRGAKVGHFLLYSVMFVLMVSGYLISTADARPISVFDWFEVPATLHGIPQQEEFAGKVHAFLAWSLIALAAGHALAAVKHHFVDKDRTLIRMLKPARILMKGIKK